MKNKAIVVFSGFNQRAVIAFLRVLTNKKLNYAIIACSKKDTIFLTEYKKHVASIRKVYNLELNDLVNSLQIVKEKLNVNKLIIAPTTEALNRFFLKHRLIFEQKGFILPLVQKELYERLSDKIKFTNLCNENDIKTPFEYNNIDKIKPPFVAKPKTYFSSNNNVFTPVLILNELDKSNFINKYSVKDFYFQEYITGNSIYLLSYFHQDGSVYMFSQENLVQQAGGKSIIAAISTNFHLSNEAKRYKKILQSLNFFGFIMIEIKGNNYMIEANPRFWGPSQLFVDAKVPLFEVFLHDQGILSNKPVNESYADNNVTYFWYGGIISSILKNERIIYHNYTSDNLVFNLHKLLSLDIYRRKDTIELFKTEVKL